MNRRELITVVSGATAALIACLRDVRAQNRIARVGVLMVVAEGDPDAKSFADAFETQIETLGWHKGRNLEINYRWGASNPERLARYGEELVQSAPDVLLSFGTPALIPLHKLTTSIPIVFTAVSDPVAQGFVTNLSHPGGNLTGFSVFEPNIGSKWLQLLKDIAPSVTNVAVMFNPRTSPYNDLWMRSIEAAAPVVGMSTTRAVILDEEDIRKTISLVSMKPGAGLIVPSDSFTYERATLIVSLAASSRLPTLYAYARFTHQGGLISYGVDLTEQLRKGANYVDRILKGDKPGDLPVQTPTRYTLTINLKTAKALGVTAPVGLLNAADEVIE